MPALGPEGTWGVEVKHVLLAIRRADKSKAPGRTHELSGRVLFPQITRKTCRTNMTNEDALRVAVAAAKNARTPIERDAHTRTAITAWRRIALDTGLNDVLFEQTPRLVEKVDAGPLDVDAPIMTPRAAWTALAAFLNFMRIGFFRTKAGETLIMAAKTTSEGRGSLLTEPVTQQGVSPDSAKEHAFHLSLVGRAAQYDAIAECGVRPALSYAATELGWKAAALGIALDLESVRRELNDAGGGARRKLESELAGHYRRMFRLWNKPANRAAAAKVKVGNTAMLATIRGTSP
jgi:hypothetical protein